jgi:hypothetical protein
MGSSYELDLMRILFSSRFTIRQLSTAPIIDALPLPLEAIIVTRDRYFEKTARSEGGMQIDESDENSRNASCSICETRASESLVAFLIVAQKAKQEEPKLSIYALFRTRLRVIWGIKIMLVRRGFMSCSLERVEATRAQHRGVDILFCTVCA